MAVGRLPSLAFHAVDLKLCSRPYPKAPSETPSEAPSEAPSVSSPRIAVITFNDVPAINPTYKYEVLGRMAIENRRQYCARHGYTFISDVPIQRDRPACWAKIPAIQDALRNHDWVAWADSDALVIEPGRPLESFCDPRFDFITQSHDRFYRFLGRSPDEARRQEPINTGVFLIRATDWSNDFLRRAYARTEFVTHAPVWDGIGEQEAMIAVLRDTPDDLVRIGYAEGLQNTPKFRDPMSVFMHFYGNRAPYRIPLPEVHAVLAAWDRAIRAEHPLPNDYARFHWCCIQNKAPGLQVSGPGLAGYFYTSQDIAPTSLSGASFIAPAEPRPPTE